MAAYNRSIITETELAFFEGSNVAGGGATSDAHNLWVGQAEAFLSDLVKYDIVTNWATLNAVYKLLFTEYAGHYTAIMALSYDTSGFPTRPEAENKINVHAWRIDAIIAILNNSDVQDFMGV